MEDNQIPTPPTPLMLPEPGLGQKFFKQLIVIGAALLLIIAGFILIYIKQLPLKNEERAQTFIPIPTTPMIIASDAFKNDDYIPGKYTCDGLDINPPLRFADIPQGAVSLALIVDDPDAPSGDWVHWLVWNMPAETNKIEENSLPPGADQGTTDFDSAKYGGPCPHTGTHHYQFKLYALDTMLNLPATAKKSDLLAAMQGHIIIEAKLTGVYSR